MIHQDKLQKVTEAIRKACPDLLEPKRNVDVLVPQNSGEKYCYFIVDLTESNYYKDIPLTYEGNVIHSEQIPVALCRNKAITDDVLERFAIKDIKILGQPIGIDSVLRALGSNWSISWDGWIRSYDKAWLPMAEWNLEKDNLNDQSEELILLLYSIFYP